MCVCVLHEIYLFSVTSVVSQRQISGQLIRRIKNAHTTKCGFSQAIGRILGIQFVRAQYLFGELLESSAWTFRMATHRHKNGQIQFSIAPTHVRVCVCFKGFRSCDEPAQGWHFIWHSRTAHVIAQLYVPLVLQTTRTTERHTKNAPLGIATASVRAQKSHQINIQTPARTFRYILVLIQLSRTRYTLNKANKPPKPSGMNQHIIQFELHTHTHTRAHAIVYTLATIQSDITQYRKL